MANESGGTQTVTESSQTQPGQSQGQGQSSQYQVDQLFSQIAGQQPGAGVEAFRAYWDLAEETLRTARRVSEVQALSMAKQEITRDVAALVIATLQQNPQLISSQYSGRSQR